MAEERAQRRLAAILAADVAGYSRMMGADEEGTLGRLRGFRRDLLDPKIAEHRGRIVKTTGDGLLAEFASVVDALRCAIEVQRGMAERNGEVEPEKRIAIRIGINVGDIIVESGDIYGDGVNVAARLERLAEPGGICVSARVQEDVRGKLDIRFEDLGELQLKNIAWPVRVYRIQFGGEAVMAGPSLTLPDRPSIAVLPFVNMSSGPEQEYLADGLTEDIVTGLSRVRGMFVIARGSTFAYKGKSVTAAQVARDLNVRYVLEGSIRTSAGRVRITAQLVDATTGHEVWAEKFDRELAGMFDLQDEITRSVVASTQTQVLLAEGSTRYRRARPNIGVWGLVNRSMARIHDLVPESLSDAKQLAEEALRLDPQCGAAWRCLSIALYHQAIMLAVSDFPDTMQQAVQTAERAIQLDANDEYAHWILGNALLALGYHERAIAELERALEINPNYAMAWGSSGTALCYVGRPEEGIARNEIAIRSDPLNPGIFFRYSGLALGHYLKGDYERAVEWARRSIHRNRNWYLGHIYLMAALAGLDRIDEAQCARAEYALLFPKATISELKRLPFKSGVGFARLTAELRKAGLSE